MRRFTLTQILMYKFKLQPTGLLVGLDHDEKIAFSKICDEAVKIEGEIHCRSEILPELEQSLTLPWLRNVFAQLYRKVHPSFPVKEAVQYLHTKMIHKDILNIF